MSKPKYTELTTWIYDELKSRILEHRLSPGKKIVQEQLADNLGVSRTPLLEVLQMLETEFLVEKVPRRGYFVREISAEEMIDVFYCREVLEGLAARLVAKRKNSSDIRLIINCFAPFIDSTETIDINEYEKADQRFHSLINKKCNNIVFDRLKMIRNIHILAYQKGLLRPPAETLPEHIKIIRAFETHNADQAEETMRMHLRRSRQSLENKINF
jgi:DNA-binding GntR family transcriptional regulator